MFKTKKVMMLFVSMLFLTGGSVEAGKGESPFVPREAYKYKQEKTYGNIHISLTDGKAGTKKEGVEFSYIKAADWKDGNYELTKQFAESKVDLNQIETSEQLENAAIELGKFCGKMDGWIRTDQNGETEVQELSEGVYLFIAKETKEYDRISPFLIAMPTWNEQDGEMMYELEVVPKHTPIPEKPKKEVIKTGDEMWQIWHWIGFGMGAAVAILSMRKMREKKK